MRQLEQEQHTEAPLAPDNTEEQEDKAPTLLDILIDDDDDEEPEEDGLNEDEPAKGSDKEDDQV